MEKQRCFFTCFLIELKRVFGFLDAFQSTKTRNGKTIFVVGLGKEIAEICLESSILVSRSCLEQTIRKYLNHSNFLGLVGGLYFNFTCLFPMRGFSILSVFGGNFSPLH